ncbi:hypothetical protein OROGR_008927 [Orobanche gracilis]
MTEAVIRNKPGMASVKDMPVLQDGPPPGGFCRTVRRREGSAGRSAAGRVRTGPIRSSDSQHGTQCYGHFSSHSWGLFLGDVSGRQRQQDPQC